MTFKKKCKTCINITKKDKYYWCKEQNNYCKDCFMNCSDKRVCCELCRNYNPKENTCMIDGHFKDGEVFRICQGFGRK